MSLLYAFRVFYGGGGIVKQITIRSVGADLYDALEHEARRRDVSMNRLVLSVLREAMGLGNGVQESAIEFHDLDHLTGTWTQQEFEEFEAQLRMQRSID
jgi:hypothetical protein